MIELKITFTCSVFNEYPSSFIRSLFKCKQSEHTCRPSVDPKDSDGLKKKAFSDIFSNSVPKGKKCLRKLKSFSVHHAIRVKHCW